MWRRNNDDEDEIATTTTIASKEAQAPAQHYVAEDEARAYWASGRSTHEAKRLMESHRDEQTGLYYLPE